MTSVARPLLAHGPGGPWTLRSQIRSTDRACLVRKHDGRELLDRVALRSSTKWPGTRHGAPKGVIQASIVNGPVSDLVRVCVFYALLQTGVAGRSSLLSAEGDGGSFMPAWLQGMFAPGGGATKDLSRIRTQWHASTKGTLVRRYRVPTKKEGRRLLTAISSLLADDDTFRDVSTHKGCQIRRENAHAESVCCNNVRALFDELPTLHLVVEITVFPPGPVTQAHYEKADKLERVLRTGTSI